MERREGTVISRIVRFSTLLVSVVLLTATMLLVAPAQPSARAQGDVVPVGLRTQYEVLSS